MQQGDVIKVGIFPVPFTPDLRSTFERIHEEMSGVLPPEEHFAIKEQEAMYAACLSDDRCQQAGNFLELIHYLASNDVPVPDILSAARCSTDLSSQGVMPRSVATRAHACGLDAYEEGQPNVANEGRKVGVIIPGYRPDERRVVEVKVSANTSPTTVVHTGTYLTEPIPIITGSSSQEDTDSRS